MSTTNDKANKNTCAACKSRHYSQHYAHHNGYSLLKCKRCHLVYLSHYPNNLFNFLDIVEDKDNKEVEFWSTPHYLQKYRPVFQKFFTQRLTRINQYKRYQKLNMLDIGIGFGGWTNFLTDQGYNCYGIDVDSNAINYCKSQNISCEVNSFEKFQTDQKFSLISLFDVLEHFEHPQEMLMKIKKLMHKDSLLYVQVPNVLGLKYPYKHSLGLPFHLWQFDPRSLKFLLDQAGFEVLKFWTGSQGIIGEYERGGPSLYVQTMWKLSQIFKRGNRMQMLVRVKYE